MSAVTDTVENNIFCTTAKENYAKMLTYLGEKEFEAKLMAWRKRADVNVFSKDILLETIGSIT